MPGTGRDIVKIAQRHVGERYENVLVPKNNPKWSGPWDCAEFASWCVYQVGGFLYGCTDNGGDPASTESYTGAWARDAKKLGQMVSVEKAAAIAGAFVLRVPPNPGSMGHIAICDGAGGTVEAHSKKRGVTTDRVSGRTWDTGVLVPGIAYTEPAEGVSVKAPKTTVLRVTKPAMTGTAVRATQRALKKLGFDPGPIDGAYGPMTAAAVAAFQQTKGLVVDGEVGAQTTKALGV